MEDNFTEEDIQSMLTYLKHHEPENANRLFAIAMLRALQQLAKDLVNKDLSKAELIAKALKKIKKSESESEESDDPEAESEESEEPESEPSEPKDSESETSES